MSAPARPRLRAVLADRRSRVVLGGVLLVALLLRVGLVVHEQHWTPFADAADYDRHAVSLAVDGRYPSSGLTPHGGPTAFRPPGYPYVLSLAYRLTGSAGSAQRYRVGRLLGAALGVLLVLLIGLLALSVHGRRVALASMAVAAVYPVLVTVGDALLSEELFAVLALSAVIALLRQRTSAHPLRWMALAGFLAGLAALTRTNGLVLAPVLALAVWSSPRLSPGSLAGPALVLAGALAAVTPWLIRDVAAFHAFVPLSTQSGYTLAGTYNDVARNDPAHPAAWRPVPLPPYAAVLARRDLNENQADQRLRSLARHYIAQHPTYLLKVGYWNTRRLLNLQGTGYEHQDAREIGITDRLSDLNVYGFAVVVLLGLCGLARPSVRRTPPWLWSVPILIGLSLVLVSGQDTRYRMPIDALLIPVAGAGAVVVGERAARWRRHTLAGRRPSAPSAPPG